MKKMTKNKIDISMLFDMFIRHKIVSSSIKENRFPEKNIVTFNEIIYFFSCYILNYLLSHFIILRTK